MAPVNAEFSRLRREAAAHDPPRGCRPSARPAPTSAAVTPGIARRDAAAAKEGLTSEAMNSGAYLMTLILGMSKTEGIYLSTDYRVTDARSGKLIDDASIKILSVTYPPLNGGPKALLAYAGLAIHPDGTAMGVWLRETLRGESETFDQSMAHLRARLDRDIAPTRIGLIVNAVVLQGTRRYLGGLSNLRLDPQKGVVVLDSFKYILNELSEPLAFANGSGAIHLGRDFRLVQQQAKVRPRRVADHMKLLAAVNRRVAVRDKTVSPFCHVSFTNADESTSPESRAFVEKDETVPFDMPVLLVGIDLSGVARALHAVVKGKTDQRDIDAAAREGLKRRP